MKENKKRIIFWGIVFLLCVFASVFGYFKYDEGYGKNGEARRKLHAVANEFNKLDSVIRKGTLETSVKEDKLVIKSKTDNKEYEYVYYKKNNIEYITSQYSTNDSVGTSIALNVVDAVYRNNKGSGSVTDFYSYDTFKTTTINDGVIYSGESNITISINLNANIVSNLAGKIPTLKEGNSITKKELVQMRSALNKDKKFRLKKEDLILYVKDNGNNYEIFFQFSNETDMFRSLVNVVDILNPSIYNHMVDVNGVINIQTDSPYYNVITNAVFNEPDIFTDTSSIYKVMISK